MNWLENRNKYIGEQQKLKADFQKQRDAVAFVFKKHGLKIPTTIKNLSVALKIAKKLNDTNFTQDLQNAVIKKHLLGHTNFEDDFDYYVVDAYEEDYDGEEIVSHFEEVYYDEFGGKMKARRAKRKIKRKNKKLSRSQKRALKLAEKMKAAQETGVIPPPEQSAEMAQQMAQDGGGGGGATIGEKIEKGLGIVGTLAQAGADIAGNFIGGKSSPNNDGVMYGNNNTSNDNDDDDDDDDTNDGSGSNKNIYYIVAAVAVIGLLFYFMKKRKA